MHCTWKNVNIENLIPNWERSSMSGMPFILIHGWQLPIGNESEISWKTSHQKSTISFNATKVEKPKPLTTDSNQYFHLHNCYLQCFYCHHVKRFQIAVQMSLKKDSMTLGESQILVVAHVAVVVPEIVLKVEKLLAHAFVLLVSAHYQALSF